MNEAFESIKQGLNEALTHAAGKPVAAVVHRPKALNRSGSPWQFLGLDEMNVSIEARGRRLVEALDEAERSK